jgi:hypothetical protein
LALRFRWLGVQHFSQNPSLLIRQRRLLRPVRWTAEFLELNLAHEITPWPPKIWDFQMLTLTAFYYHPDLDVVRARWGTAQAGVITAGQRPNPDIGFTPEYTVEEQYAR